MVSCELKQDYHLSNSIKILADYVSSRNSTTEITIPIKQLETQLIEFKTSENTRNIDKLNTSAITSNPKQKNNSTTYFPKHTKSRESICQSIRRHHRVLSLGRNSAKLNQSNDYPITNTYMSNLRKKISNNRKFPYKLLESRLII